MQEREDPVLPTAHELTEDERETRRQEQIRRNQALIDMLNVWSQEDRPSHRQLFP